MSMVTMNITAIDTIFQGCDAITGYSVRHWVKYKKISIKLIQSIRQL